MRILLVLLFICVHGGSVLADSTLDSSQSCFIVKEQGRVIRQEGECSKRYSPRSTFKIVLSLVGFDSGILVDENNPVWMYSDNCDNCLSIWKTSHSPQTFFRDSCVWYGMKLASQLGSNRLRDYLKSFGYGSYVGYSDDKNSVDDLIGAWLRNDGVIAISPAEQVDFITKVVDHKLKISASSYDKLKKIMFVEELPGGWKLYAKTGNGMMVDKDGLATKSQHGWFVGYIEKGNRKVVFVNHLVDTGEQKTFASLRAKGDAFVKLWYVVDALESKEVGS